MGRALASREADQAGGDAKDQDPERRSVKAFHEVLILDRRRGDVHDGPMSDEKKPDPVDDLKKGLGLLFRAAKTAVDELQTGKLEEAVKTGAREVGRAIENVTSTIDEQIFHGKARAKTEAAPPPAVQDAPPPAAQDARDTVTDAQAPRTDTQTPGTDTRTPE